MLETMRSPRHFRGVSYTAARLEAIGNARIYALCLAYLWAVRCQTRTLDQIRHRLDRRIETGAASDEGDRSPMGRMMPEEDFFLLSHLSPRRTGLPFVVWISAQGGAEQEICVKISRHAKMKPGELITVALRPQIHALGSAPFTVEELALLTEWGGKNGAVLLAYWNQEIDTVEAISALQPVRR